MNQRPKEHPDYENFQSILSTIAQWVSRYRDAFATHNELRNCSPDDVAGIARDLKIGPGELNSLAKNGPNAAALLRRLLLALGVNPNELENCDPTVMRDLERLCITCGYKRQCELDLATGMLADKFQDYCPNAFTLVTLLRAKQ
jgi:pyrroloquinoline quinone (PQQ) biosynthesis protein C